MKNTLIIITLRLKQVLLDDVELVAVTKFRRADEAIENEQAGNSSQSWYQCLVVNSQLLDSWSLIVTVLDDVEVVCEPTCVQDFIACRLKLFTSTHQRFEWTER